MAGKDDIRKHVREKLVPFIRDFDKENRGNRISTAIISGLGGFLEDMIVGLIDEWNKAGHNSPLHDRFTKLMKDHGPATGEPPHSGHDDPNEVFD